MVRCNISWIAIIFAAQTSSLVPHMGNAGHDKDRQHSSKLVDPCLLDV